MHKVKQFQDISIILLKNKLFGWIGAFNSSTTFSLALEETVEKGLTHIFNILRHLNTDTMNAETHFHAYELVGIKILTMFQHSYMSIFNAFKLSNQLSYIYQKHHKIHQ